MYLDCTGHVLCTQNTVPRATSTGAIATTITAATPQTPGTADAPIEGYCTSRSRRDGWRHISTLRHTVAQQLARLGPIAFCNRSSPALPGSSGCEEMLQS